MVKLPDHAGGLGAARLGLMKFCDTDFSRTNLVDVEVMDVLDLN